MKSTIEPDKDEYPCLKISKDGNDLVLFTAHNTGMAVCPTSCGNPIGRMSNCWNEDRFVPFKGKVILEN